MDARRHEYPVSVRVAGPARRSDGNGSCIDGMGRNTAVDDPDAGVADRSLGLRREHPGREDPCEGEEGADHEDR